MAEYKVPVFRFSNSMVKEHPNPEVTELEIINYNGYNIVSSINSRPKEGSFIVFIPPFSVIPDPLIEKLGIGKYLATKNKNVLKPKNIRGVLSEGIIFESDFLNEFDDVSEYLGIYKYEAPVPVHMGGDTKNTNGFTYNYDIESYKRHNIDELLNNIPIVLTEKIHGTLCAIGYNYDKHFINKGWFVSSKGNLKNGNVFDLDDNKNIYVKTFNSIKDKLNKITDTISVGFFILFGEIYGDGIQDLKYGQSKPTIRFFDMLSTYNQTHNIQYKSWDDLQSLLQYVNLNSVPEICRGKYSKSLINNNTDGPSTIYGADHLREGIVFRPVNEYLNFSYPHGLNRLIFKSVSNQYLTRHKGTEYS